MEDFLIIILQFLLEFIFNVVINLPFDWPRRNRRTPESEAVAAVSFVLFCVGCGLAWGTLLVFPRTLIKIPALRIANLFLSPVSAAYVGEVIAAANSGANDLIVARNHFWWSFWFTVGFVAVRFAYVLRH